MKKVLILCNTYFQLIVAMQLKHTINKGDEVYVVLSDHSKNAKDIYFRLKEENYFKDVWYYDTKKIVDHTKIRGRLRILLSGIVGYNLLKFPNDLYFDEIIGFNLDIPAHLIYSYCKKKNKNLVCNRFEEGIFSYHTQPDNCRELKIIYKLRSLIKKTNMRTEPKLFYCFSPQFYDGELLPVQIPKIQKSDLELARTLRNIFEIPENEYNNCKYLYLPCIYDIEGGGAIGELDLAKKIAEYVGIDALLVKPHPRDDKNKYIEAGFHVDKISHVPLEALIICNYYGDITFLTSLSGSILTIFNLFQIDARGYYLYPYCDLDNNKTAQHYSRILEKYNTNQFNITIVRRGATEIAENNQ